MNLPADRVASKRWREGGGCRHFRFRPSPHSKLKAFELADKLGIAVYEKTTRFPKQEVFGLTSQLRRSAVSTASNIVEGCARHSESEYLHFLDMAYGSAREVEYQIGLSHRLGFLPVADYETILPLAVETAKVLNGLIRSLRKT